LSNQFHFPSSDREERFGQMKFDAAWEKPQTEAGCTLLGYIHNVAPVGGPAMCVYRGPQGQHEAAQRARAARIHAVGGDAMTLFCPEGYVPVRAAIERAAQYWFPEQVAAIETAVTGELAGDGKPNDSVSALTPAEQLKRALGSQRSISEGLRQRIENVFTQTEHRLRTFLHRDTLSVYYFGTLFDQGRQTAPPAFWATTEADGALLSGTYWPFGRPRTRYEQKPASPLFFLETELTALLSKSAVDPVDIHKPATCERQWGPSEPVAPAEMAPPKPTLVTGHGEKVAATPSKTLLKNKKRSAPTGPAPLKRNAAAKNLKRAFLNGGLKEIDMGPKEDGGLPMKEISDIIGCSRTELAKVLEIVFRDTEFARFQEAWEKRHRKP
jgi:hypothetical protein